jgi:hypothetical protein
MKSYRKAEIVRHYCVVYQKFINRKFHSFVNSPTHGVSSFLGNYGNGLIPFFLS